MEFNLAESLKDIQQWPQCPKCQERSLLVGARMTCCIQCSYMGSTSDIESTGLYRFARVKMATRGSGHRGIISFMETPRAAGDLPALLDEGASRLAQRMIHAPLLTRAARHLEKERALPPMVFMNRTPEYSPLQSFALRNRDEVERAKMAALNRDVVSLVWIANSIGDQSFRTPEVGRRFLMINTHIYNAPSHLRALEYFHKPESGEVEWLASEPLLNARETDSWVWQPICWRIIPYLPGRLEMRYVAAIEVEHDINVTFCVCEDMDGAPLVRAAFRKPWRTEPPEIKEYRVASAEEGVGLLREKFHDLCRRCREPGIGAVVFEYEQEWPMDLNPHLAMRALRTAPFWGQYAEQRKMK